MDVIQILFINEADDLFVCFRVLQQLMIRRKIPEEENAMNEARKLPRSNNVG